MGTIRNNCLRKYVAGVLFVSLCGLTACVNHIPGEDDNGADKGSDRVEVTFLAEIEPAATRMTGDAFEQGDRVGLFAVTPTGSLAGKRYADNLMMEYQSDGSLTLRQSLYYPEDGTTLDFFCYFPYQQEGMPAGTSQLPVKVQTNQSDDEAFENSDFLVATATGVSADSGPVLLHFGHRMAKIEVVLVPSGKMTAEELLAAEPRVVGVNFQTEGVYDPKTDSFSALSGVGDIVTHGSWERNGERLVGKEFLVLPQDVGYYGRGLILEIGDRILTCEVEAQTLRSGSVLKVVVPVPDEGETVTATGSVEEWSSSEQTEGQTSEQCEGVHIAALGFGRSNGYRVCHEGEVMAEVWREYLCNGTDAGSQALVAYPVKNGECDLEDGLLLQWVGSTTANCGGKLSWWSSGLGYDYTGGVQSPIETLYVSADGTLTTEAPTNALSVTVNSLSMTDTRDNDQTQYPIAKIGTQFWLAQDLRARSYADGTPLVADRDTLSGKSGCFYKMDGQEIYFYSGETLIESEMAPEGYKLPTESDWTQLRSYLNGDVSVLKTGTWKVARDSSKEVQAATNLTGFGAYAAGMWTNAEVVLYQQVAAYWSWDEKNSKPTEKLVMLYGEESGFITDISSYSSGRGYKAVSVRCLKE